MLQALAVMGALAGLWRVLLAIIRGRVAVALEHARSAATVAAIERLPPGGRLLEHDGSGHTRTIEIPQCAPNPQMTWQGRDDTIRSPRPFLRRI